MAVSSAPDDAVLFLERDSDAVELLEIAGGLAACASRRSPARDSANEDAAAIVRRGKGGVLVVADGAGGSRGGAQASALAVRELLAALRRAPADATSLREAILDGLELANRRIAELGIGAATTVALAELHPGSLRTYHVGDSGLLLLGQKGKLKLRSVAHSPVGYAQESGLLPEEEALQHPERHLVYNLVGTADMRVEIGSTRELGARDTLLVASDGLFDNLSTEEIVETLRCGSLAESTAELVRRADARMRAGPDGRPSKPDDLTVLVFRRES